MQQKKKKSLTDGLRSLSLLLPIQKVAAASCWSSAWSGSHPSCCSRPSEMFWGRSGELRLSRDLRFQVQDLIAPGDCCLLSLYSRPLLSLEPERRCIDPGTCATLRVGRGGFSVPVDPQAACSPGSFCCGVHGQSSAVPSGLPGHVSPTDMKKIGNAVNDDDANEFHDSVEIWVTTG